VIGVQLSFNEIKERAIIFSNEWKNCTSERAEAKSFWDDFFYVFGLDRKRVATFEKPVRKNGSKIGYIDLFWKRTLVVEHKSKGQNLDKAYTQALEYFEGLNDDELPKYVIVSDFERFRIFDLENDGVQYQFQLNDFYKNIHLFSFITGYKKISFKEEPDVNIHAGELIGSLYTSLKDNNYNEHDLTFLLIRILFCLFADYTGIWLKNHFEYYIRENTRANGSDLGIHLNLIFEVLNTREESRQININEDLQYFRYINGGLFKEKLSVASFDENTRELLLKCCNFNWSKISPVIFGSIFQSAMDPIKRNELGIHYTSEKDILKVIEPLILNNLRDKFNKHKHDLYKLEQLLIETRKIKVLDPSCGCGNFLVLVYREIRLLQIDILKQIAFIKGMHSGVNYIQQQFIECKHNILDVDSMYGFEIDELAIRIGQVALWLIDHHLNILMSQEFGESFTRLPIAKIANIHNVNALRVDWDTIADKNEISYIVGNPPFIPSNDRTPDQRKDMDVAFNNKNIKFDNYKRLDYVSAWYVQAAKYIRGTQIKAAFISTNSITQGEQVEILWEPLLRHGININFAHKSFNWKNGLSYDASVYVCIIGFSYSSKGQRTLYEYETPTSEPHTKECSNINPYLLDKPNVIVKARSIPINPGIMPKASKGSMPNDDGYLILTDEEKIDICKNNEGISRYIRPFVSAYTILRDIPRWCIWLENENIDELKKYKSITDRIEKVKHYRKNTSKSKRALDYPYLFETLSQPSKDYIVIPCHTSQNRNYIPMKIVNKEWIVNNSCIAVHSDDKYILGILMSSMHMAWIKEFAGRLKGDYRYSIKLCYNTFPFITPTSKQNEEITNCVEQILKIRNSYPTNSLATLYDPNFMRKDLLEAHKKLDRTVERLYSNKKLDTDRKKVDILLEHHFDLINIDRQHSG
jgi:hypothetical protein